MLSKSDLRLPKGLEKIGTKDLAGMSRRSLLKLHRYPLC